MNLDKVVEELLEKAAANNGCVLSSEILAYCTKDSKDYSNIISALEEKDVEIVEKEEDAIKNFVDTEVVPLEVLEDDKIEQMANSTSYDDPVRMYLKQIGKYKLLDVETEKRLAEDVANGTIAEARLKSNDYTSEELEDLKMQVKRAKRARERLVNSNLRLVVSIAKKYISRGLDFLDLIQEGSLGLIKSVDKYELEKGYKFSTYATWWIRQAITRAIADKARTIRIPVHMVENINKYYKCTRDLTGKLGRIPTIEEIAEEMHMSEDKILQIQKIAQEPVSLESPVGEEEDSTLGDFIPDTSAEDPYRYTFQKQKEAALDEALSTLSDREERVLRLRYGLTEDGRERTLEEVGEEFDLTRERIRQIQAKAITRLRQPSKSKKLEDFLTDN